MLRGMRARRLRRRRRAPENMFADSDDVDDGTERSCQSERSLFIDEMNSTQIAEQ